MFERKTGWVNKPTYVNSSDSNNFIIIPGTENHVGKIATRVLVGIYTIKTAESLRVSVATSQR